MSSDWKVAKLIQQWAEGSIFKHKAHQSALLVFPRLRCTSPSCSEICIIYGHPPLQRCDNKNKEAGWTGLGTDLQPKLPFKPLLAFLCSLPSHQDGSSSQPGRSPCLPRCLPWDASREIAPCQQQHSPAASELLHVTTPRRPQGHLVEEGNVWFALAKISRRV